MNKEQNKRISQILDKTNHDKNASRLIERIKVETPKQRKYIKQQLLVDGSNPQQKKVDKYIQEEEQRMAKQEDDQR